MVVRGRVGPPRWGPLRFRVQEGFDGSAGVNLDDFFLFLWSSFFLGTRGSRLAGAFRFRHGLEQTRLAALQEGFATLSFLYFVVLLTHENEGVCLIRKQ